MKESTRKIIIHYWELTIDELKEMAEQKEWYTKAAEQGEKAAQLSLGLFYLHGNGVERDEKKAVEWLTKSADQDFEPAEFCLGECYRDGIGIEKDLDKANELFSKAMERETKKQLELKDSKENSNVKNIVSPLQKDAFSEPVIHQAVMNQIDFVLPDSIWEHINEAFEHYWDDEIGVGGYFDYDTLFHSIKNQLIAAQVLYPDHLLFRVIEAIYNFIDKIPGVVIHD